MEVPLFYRTRAAVFNRSRETLRLHSVSLRVTALPSDCHVASLLAMTSLIRRFRKESDTCLKRRKDNAVFGHRVGAYDAPCSSRNASTVHCTVERNALLDPHLRGRLYCGYNYCAAEDGCPRRREFVLQLPGLSRAGTKRDAFLQDWVCGLRLGGVFDFASLHSE